MNVPPKGTGDLATRARTPATTLRDAATTTRPAAATTAGGAEATHGARATTQAAPGAGSDAYDVNRGGAKGAVPADVVALLGRLGLEQEKKPTVERRFAGNVKKLVDGLQVREKTLVGHVVSVLKAVGLATRSCASFSDLRQLKDFATLAIENGRPLAVFSPLADVAGFVLKYPDEARKILKFLDQAEGATFKQKTPWMRPVAPGIAAVGASQKPPVKKADVVVIGGGLSAGYIVRNFADAMKDGSSPKRNIMVLEKDSKASREHAASLRNAGIICTSLDYVFDIDEAVGDTPVKRIAEALAIPHGEAEGVFKSLVSVMAGARAHVQEFLQKNGVDVDLKPVGGLDVATTKEELDAFRDAAVKARALGLDWTAIDQDVLSSKYGVESGAIKGALQLNDSAQLNPGKLVKALFDHATANSKNVALQFDTEVTGARAAPDGKGWILETNQGEVHATEVIDAREAFAPYKFREARFSQIHVVDVGDGGATTGLGDTNVCHGLSYMRKISDGKFLCGSGDFPLQDPHETPRPLASVALYAAAHFKQLFPDQPFDIEHVWGGVFGRSPDDLPVAGELLKGWHVVGGAGGSGLNLTPALGRQAALDIMGKGASGPLASEHFSPRRFFVKELREEITRAAHSLVAHKGLDVEHVRVEIADHKPSHKNQAGVPVRRGDELVFQVDEKTLDAMNTSAAALFGPHAADELKAREAAKDVWVKAQVAALAKGLVLVEGGAGSTGAATTGRRVEA